ASYRRNSDGTAFQLRQGQANQIIARTQEEMMVRLDDFVQSKENFANTELLKGEVSQASRKTLGHVSKREYMFHRGGYEADR
nr:hypothetical protein [Tanacetum cinerariifolium]